MTYKETTDFLFGRLAAFHRIGAAAYKPGLETTLKLSALFGNPHTKFRTIHVGGTNGKGSTAHTVAAILQSAGYRVGLYTSPHLLDFAERIRVNGKPIEHEKVTDFVERYLGLADNNTDPSFFELATIMAFEHFATCGVDVAVIEVGLGGRLDSTNIIDPDLSIITNISLDHTSLLGKTRAEIASEKAGIIKPDKPVVIGENDAEIAPVFKATATACGSPLTDASASNEIIRVGHTADAMIYTTRHFGTIKAELTGEFQQCNTPTILAAVGQLRKLGYNIDDQAVSQGFANVCSLTGLMARWMTIPGKVTTVCDTGHNPGAWQYLGPRLDAIAKQKSLHIVLGFVADKDIDSIMKFLPNTAKYYFVEPSTPRRASAIDVAAKAATAGLHGSTHTSVMDGYNNAVSDAADAAGVVFVGGSTFVVADMLEGIGYSV